MSHIADLHTTGRCGQHRSIEAARGAYAQLINKEIRTAEIADIRRIMIMMNVTCPRCGTPVSTVSCHVCRFFPIPLPATAEVLRIETEQRRRKGLLSADADGAPRGRGGPSAGVAAALGAAGSDRGRYGSDAGSSQRCRSGSRASQASHASDRSESTRRLQRLEALVEVERAERHKMLSQIETVKGLLATAGVAVDVLETDAAKPLKNTNTAVSALPTVLPSRKV